MTEHDCKKSSDDAGPFWSHPSRGRGNWFRDWHRSWCQRCQNQSMFLSYREPSFNYAECQEILQTSVGQKVKRTIFYWSIHMYIYFAIPVFLGWRPDGLSDSESAVKSVFGCRPFDAPRSEAVSRPGIMWSTSAAARRRCGGLVMIFLSVSSGN